MNVVYVVVIEDSDYDYSTRIIAVFCGRAELMAYLAKKNIFPVEHAARDSFDYMVQKWEVGELGAHATITVDHAEIERIRALQAILAGE